MRDRSGKRRGMGRRLERGAQEKPWKQLQFESPSGQRASSSTPGLRPHTL